MTSVSGALGRLVLFVGWTLVLIPPYALLMATGLRVYRRVARFYWAVCAAILGMRLVVRGRQAEDKPVLFVANHASYLDIVVLGALIDGAFVAKQEVGTWPGIGLIAKLGRTIFVDRRRGRSRDQRDAMRKRLADGESLILFPEGTSNDGNRVLPFKSALFSVAEMQPDGRPLTVQPVSIAYTRLDGLPIGRGWRPYFAWYGDMTLPPHLWTALGLGRLTIEVDFHPPVSIDAFGSRKSLSDYCHGVVSQGAAAALAGRAGAGTANADKTG